MKYYQGKYRLKNPQKYKGDPSNVIYRSSWELKFLNYCDTNPDIIKFSSEEIVIPYVSPIDGKRHRYFVDFYMKVKQTDGTIKEYLVEIKPKRQTQPPATNPTRKTKQWLNEVVTWGKNQSKWDAAREYCKDRNWEFLILTEKELNV
jgi:hypothetical protein